MCCIRVITCVATFPDFVATSAPSLSHMKMLSSVVDGVGGGGYDCFPALAAAGIERAAGEGGREGGRKREGPGGGVGPGKGRERRGWFS